MSNISKALTSDLGRIYVNAMERLNPPPTIHEPDANELLTEEIVNLVPRSMPFEYHQAKFQKETMKRVENSISDDLVDRLWEKMYHKKVIEICGYCGSGNAFDNSTCCRCGSPPTWLK